MLTDTYRVTAANDTTGQSGQLLTPVTVNNVITLSKTVEAVGRGGRRTGDLYRDVDEYGQRHCAGLSGRPARAGFIPGTYTTNVAVPGAPGRRRRVWLSLLSMLPHR
jgi:hypothetical protein